MNTTFGCLYANSTEKDPKPENNIMQFVLAVDTSIVGLFQQSSDVEQASITPGGDFPADPNDFSYNLPLWENVASRAVINRVFPCYLFIAMWSIIMQTLVFYSWILRNFRKAIS
jgi:hypothetical protein